jgi:hypothetical protein
MAASAEQKAVVLNLLKQKNAQVTALQGVLDAAITDLDGESTAAELQAGVAAYNLARTTNKALYGNVVLPAMDAAEA